MTNQTPTQERKEVRLLFAPDISGEPVVCNLVRNYDTLFNILSGQIGPRKEGHLTLELLGSSENINRSIAYLKECGVKVLGFSNKVTFNQENCMHCGMCTAMCKVEALYVDVNTRLTNFVSEKCIACGLCTKICPVNAMQMDEQQKQL